ncbi:MAG: hypothetical protein KDA52_11940 [Planctomycetaceae bacterium]|nr:hypothetical protein [Planctomycetaceae bacterium]
MGTAPDTGSESLSDDESSNNIDENLFYESALISSNEADEGKIETPVIASRSILSIHADADRELDESSWSERYRRRRMEEIEESERQTAKEQWERDAALRFGLEYAQKCISEGRVDRTKATRNIRQFLEYGLRQHSLDQTLTPSDLALARRYWGKLSAGS